MILTKHLPLHMQQRGGGGAGGGGGKHALNKYTYTCKKCAAGISRSLQRRASTLQLVELTAGVFETFYKILPRPRFSVERTGVRLVMGHFTLDLLYLVFPFTQ